MNVMTDHYQNEDATNYIRKAESGMPHDILALKIIKELLAHIQELEKAAADRAGSNIKHCLAHWKREEALRVRVQELELERDAALE